MSDDASKLEALRTRFEQALQDVQSALASVRSTQGGLAEFCDALCDLRIVLKGISKRLLDYESELCGIYFRGTVPRESVREFEVLVRSHYDVASNLWPGLPERRGGAA